MTNDPPVVVRGRGAADNPANRFERIIMEPDPDWNPEEDSAPTTQFLRDHTRAIINYNDSPDIGFRASINPYRGCEHGCIYCYARPTHEYLGFSAGLDFESRIMVKEDAPELLRRELSARKWKPQVIAMSGVTDCYQPAEKKFKLTRRCLEVLAEFRNPVAVITKNFLITRDLDILSELARHKAAAAFISVTTLDASLATKLEPRASLPQMRLAAIAALHQAGVPVGVMVAPCIPGLTDYEMPSIIAAAVAAGAQKAGYVPVRLPYGVGPLFEAWLENHYPERKEKVLESIRRLRGGKINDPNFGTRMRGEGKFADQMENLFSVSCRKAGLKDSEPILSTAAFRVPLSESSHTQSIFPF